MAKIIKIKQSDIKNIVKNVINEQNEMQKMDQPPSQDGDISIVKDQNGKFYVLNTKSGEILGEK